MSVVMDTLQTIYREFHFLRPYWLLGLPLLALAGLLWRRRKRASSDWSRVVDAHLLPALLDPGDGHHRGAQPWLLPVLVVLLLLALAGPAWQQVPQPLIGRQAGLVVLLDLSEGMLAGDVVPDRLTRVRYKLADLLRSSRDGQIGLVAYAGDAFTVAPLTEDRATLEALLGSLQPEVMPVAGQRLDRALRVASTLLHDAGFSRGDVLVISYAAGGAKPLAPASEPSSVPMRVSVLAVGSEAGAPVPLPGGGFLRDTAGDIVLPKLQRADLRALAASYGGRYAELSDGNADIEALGLLDAADSDESSVVDDHTSLRYRDDGPWLLLLALPLAALCFRRGWAFCLLLCVALPRPAAALEWADLWQRGDQRAWQSLQADQPKAARELAQDPALRGSAAYREKDYAAAASEFAQSGDSAQDHYNRGNALAQAGKLQEALDAYANALQRDPALEDAQFNRDLVQRVLDDKNAQSSSDGEGEQQDSSEKAGDQSTGEGKPGEPGDDKPDANPPSSAPENRESTSSESSGDEQGQKQPDSTGNNPSDAGTGDEQAGDQVDQKAQDAHQQAIDQALQEAKQGATEAASPQPLDPGEAEKQQAAEQALRRVVDDPGGLLRRKFALEHRRRLMEEQQQ